MKKEATKQRDGEFRRKMEDEEENENEDGEEQKKEMVEKVQREHCMSDHDEEEGG